MRGLRFVRRYPLALLGLLAIAFCVWVFWDAVAPQRVAVPPPSEESEAPSDLRMRRLPLPPGVYMKARLNPHDTAQALPLLKPGMTRAEVEGFVGRPAAQDVHPATIRDGKVTYQITYEADLEPPATVRPIRIPRRHSPERDPSASEWPLVALEFDATRAGHPLLGVIYPDPLF